MTLPLPRPLPPPLPYPSQEKRVKEQSAHLLSKNLEVEEAVRDLVQLVCNYELRTTDKVVCPEALGKVYAHYAQLMYNAVLVCTQQSLLGLKRRVGSRPIAGIVQVDRPFFDVQVELDVPNVAMSPSLDDIQQAINRCSRAVLACSQHLPLWSSDPSTASAGEGASLYEVVTRDREVGQGLGEG